MLQRISIDVTDEFLHQFKNWRQKRPEWRQFVETLKCEGTPREALLRAAAAAGASMAEAEELRFLATRVRREAGEAERLEAAENAVAGAQRNLERARLRRGERGLSLEEAEGVAREIYDAEQRVSIAESGAVGPRLAAAVREEAKALGLVD